MKSKLKTVFEVLCSGLAGVILTLVVQYFFPQQYTFIIDGEKVQLTEVELQEQVENLESQLAETNQELNTTKESLDQAERQVVELQQQIDENDNIESTIAQAKDYATNNDYVNAIKILSHIDNKSYEVEQLISDYTSAFENTILAQVDTLLNNNQLDKALEVINDAISSLPENSVLNEKRQEVEDSIPKNMIDIEPAYQSGGNTYTEYSASASGATDYFSMGGVKYTNGMTFNADYNIFDDVSWAVYYLEGQYQTLEFVVCHVDGTYNGDDTTLQIFYDEELREEIPLSPDMAPITVKLDLTGVNQLKMQVPASGADGPVYGIGDPKIK